MQFFKALDGTMYPVSEIKSISKPKEVTFQPAGRKGKIHTVELRDNNVVEIEKLEFDSIQDRPTHMFAAHPGTNLLHFDSDEQSHWTTPVIGWAMTAEGLLYPVTSDGINDGSMRQNFDVQLHDGSVMKPMDQSFGSIEEWKAAMIERHAKEKGAK